jgi:hypothetical protein
MEELLKGLIGKKLDINSGAGSMFNGELISVENGIAVLRNDDDQTLYVSIAGIRGVTESNSSQSRPGFIV